MFWLKSLYFLKQDKMQLGSGGNGACINAIKGKKKGQTYAIDKDSQIRGVPRICSFSLLIGRQLDLRLFGPPVKQNSPAQNLSDLGPGGSGKI